MNDYKTLAAELLLKVSSYEDTILKLNEKLKRANNWNTEFQKYKDKVRVAKQQNDVYTNILKERLLAAGIPLPTKDEVLNEQNTR